MSEPDTDLPDPDEVGGYPSLDDLDVTRGFDFMVGAMAGQAVEYAETTIEMGYADDYPDDHPSHDPAYWIPRGVIQQLEERDEWRTYVDAHLHGATVHYFGRPFPAEVLAMDRDDRLDRVMELLRDEVTERALAQC